MKSNFIKLQLLVRMWQYHYKPSRYKKKQILKSNSINLYSSQYYYNCFLQLQVKMWQYLYKPPRYKKKQIMKSNFIKLQLLVRMWQYHYKPSRYKKKQIMKSNSINLYSSQYYYTCHLFRRIRFCIFYINAQMYYLRYYTYQLLHRKRRIGLDSARRIGFCVFCVNAGMYYIRWHV